VTFFCQIGMSPALSRHFGHLFIRDPLVVIQEQLHPKDALSSYHFEVSLSLFFYRNFLKFRT
jgi:hypothetical protein